MNKSPKFVAISLCLLASTLMPSAAEAQIDAGDASRTTVVLATGSNAAGPSATTTAPIWLKHQRKVRAGADAKFLLDPVSASYCQLKLRGPRQGQRLDRLLRGDGDLAKITLDTQRTAASGKWRLQARCVQPDHTTLTSKVTLRVVRGQGRRPGMLVSQRQIEVTRRSPFPSSSGQGLVQGNGASANRFDLRQCTSWAYEKRQDVYDRAVAAGVPESGRRGGARSGEDYVWNGKRWAENARAAGIPTGPEPVVGALFVSTKGTYGHVAYVEAVNADGSYDISQRNATGLSNSTAVTTTTVAPGRPNVEFVYGGPASGAEFIGSIVQWDGDTKVQKTAWLVVNNQGHPQRQWIPDISTYGCLKRRGVPGPVPLPSSVLTYQLPDQTGVSVVCADGGGGEPPPTTPPPPPPPPAVVTLTVYNKVTNTATEMREDTPAYLSTAARNYCRRDGCMVAGSERSTGGTYAPAICQVQGARTTNGVDAQSFDDANPGLFTSTRWYGVGLSGGGVGYISEVWIDPSQRGGLNLPNC